jgi:hypothetical protein
MASQRFCHKGVGDWMEKEHWAGEKKEGFLASLAMTIMGDDGTGGRRRETATQGRQQRLRGVSIESISGRNRKKGNGKKV